MNVPYEKVWDTLFSVMRPQYFPYEKVWERLLSVIRPKFFSYEKAQESNLVGKAPPKSYTSIARFAFLSESGPQAV